MGDGQYSLDLAMCKSRNKESGNGMKGMMGMQGIIFNFWLGVELMN